MTDFNSTDINLNVCTVYIYQTWLAIAQVQKYWAPNENQS